MKNLLKFGFAVVLLGGLTFLNSCSEDEVPEEAVISISIGGTDASKTEFMPNDGINLSVTYVVEGGLSGFNVTETIDGTAEPKEYFSPANLAELLSVDESTLEFGSTFNLEISSDYPIGSSVTIEFEVVDLENNTATAEFTFTVTGTAVTTEQVVLLVPPLDNKDSDTFYSTNTNTIYSMNDVNNTSSPVSADIDFGYFYGTSNAASLASPSNYPFAYGQSAWGTLNTTLFRTTTLDSDGFNAIATEEEIVAEFEVGSGETDFITNLSVGDVIAFKTDSDKADGSKFGLIHIDGITGTSGSDGKIDFTVIVQQ